MTTAAPEYYVRTTAYSSRCRTPSIIICSIHFGARQAERDWERERVLRPAAPFDCANVCAALEMCVSCYCCCIRRFTFLSATGGGSGEGGNCFLCALPAALKYFAYASSGLKRRLTMQGTKYVAILALCTLLISPPPCHSPLSIHSLHTLCQFVDKFVLPRRPERHLRNRVWNFGRATC